MIIPGIFEETIEKAERELESVGSLAPKIQLDMADGNLVDGKTFLDLGFLMDTGINSEIQLHLMVQRPESFLLKLPPIIKDVCVQAEAFMYRMPAMDSFVEILEARGIRMGLSFNLKTPFDILDGYLKETDYIQLMSINPGGQGRSFDMEILDRIADFKEKFPNMFLQIDGGINSNTLNMVVETGIDAVIVGSALFKTLDPKQEYKNFVLQFDNAHRNFLHSQRTG